MNRYVIGLILIIYTSLCGENINILQNPSFEIWSSLHQPENWIVEDTAAVYKESTCVFHENYAVKLKRLQVGTGHNVGFFQIISIPARGRYTAHVRFFDNTDSLTGGITITWRRADTSFIIAWSTVYTLNAPNWQVVQKTDTAPLEAALVEFRFRTYGTTTTPAGGTFVVDSAFFGLPEIGITESNKLPIITTLQLIKPNPATSRLTQISFSLAEPSRISLKIYDALGRLVKTLINQYQTSGIYSITWDGKDEHKRTVTEGVYFYTLETPNQTFTKKLVLMK